MEIREERVKDAVVLHATGRLDAHTATAFEGALLERIDKKPARLVIDLEGVEYISSAGLRAILVAVKRGKALGCPLAACGLRPNIREVFDLSGFGNLIPLHASVSEAANS